MTDEQGEKPISTRRKAKTGRERLPVLLRWLTMKLNLLIHRVDRRTNEGKAHYVRRSLERFSSLGISNMAATLSYYLIFALFPFLMFVASMIALVGGSIITPEMLQYFKTLIPEQVAAFIARVLGDISRSAGFSLASIGFIALLWSASRGFAVLVYTMDLVYENKRTTATYFIQQLISLLMTFFIVFALFLVMLSMAFGQYIIELINSLFKEAVIKGSWSRYLNFIVAFIFLAILFSLVYYFSSKRRGRFRHAFFCGILIALGWVLVSYGFSIYLTTTTRYSLLYGSLTGIVILMLWLYICANLLLSGGLIHSEILYHKGLRENGKAETEKNTLREKYDNKVGKGPVGAHGKDLAKKGKRRR